MTVTNEPVSSYRDDVVGSSKREGQFTQNVEEKTARIPSLVFLGLAGGAVALSLGIKIAGYDKTANFVGQWVPTILLLGIYNKIVKEKI